jgi:GNAT superfamily N-acetyltransferase
VTNHFIRPATADDVPGVLPMVRAICDLHQRHDPQRFKVRPDVLERYAKWLPERAADPRSVFLVAEQHAGTDAPAQAAPARARTLVGFTVGTIEPEVPIFWVPECGWIHDLWVEPEQRRAGVARALAQAAVDRFRALGVAQVRLHTGVFNDAARAAFGSIGFRPCVVEMLKPLTGPAEYV